MATNPFLSGLSDFFTPHSVIRARTEEALRTQQAEARMMGVAKAGEFSQAAGSRQEAIQRFLADPEAMTNYFVQGAGDVKDFTSLFEGITPKPFEQTNVGQGTDVLVPGTDGKPSVAYSNPSDFEQKRALDEQTIPPAVLREIRRMVGSSDPSMKERAVAEMIANNPGNQRIRELGIKVRGELIEETSYTDPQTGRTYPVLMDLQTGQPIAPPGADMLPDRQTQAPSPQLSSNIEFNPKEMRTVNVPAKLSPLFDNTERVSNLPPGFLSRMAAFESGFDVTARGKDGEMGMMQFMPKTAKDVGLQDPDNPEQAVAAAGLYVNAMRTRFDGNLAYAIAGYNWGPGNVDKWLKAGADPNKLPAKTLQYIDFVLGAKQANDLLFPDETMRKKEEQAAAAAEVVVAGGGVPDMGAGPATVESAQDLEATAIEGAFATGPVPSAAAFYNQTAGLALGNVRHVEQDGRAALAGLQKYAQYYFERSGTESNEDVKRVIAMLPSLGIAGAFETPYRGIQKLITLHGVVSRNMNADAAIYNNAGRFPSKVVDAAVESWKRGHVLLQMIGTRQELATAKKRALKESQNPELLQNSIQLWNQIFGGGEEGDETSLQMELQGIEKGTGTPAPSPEGLMGSEGADDLAGGMVSPGGDLLETPAPAMARAVPPGPAVQLSPDERAKNIRTEMEANKLAERNNVPRPIVDVALGIREASVEALAIPADVIRNVFTRVGLAHLSRPELQTDEATAEVMRNDFRRAGYLVDAPNTLAAKYGKGAFQAGLMATTLTFAAPRIAAIKGEAYVAQLINKVSTWVSKNPGKFTAEAASGGGAAAVGEELADQAGLEGATKAGVTIASGVVGGGLANIPFNAAKNVGVGTAKGVERVLGSVLPVGKSGVPIRGASEGASAVQSFGKQMAASVHSKATSRKGTLATFTKQDPDKAVEKIFSGRNPEGDMRKIVAATRPSKEASEGLKDGVIDYLFRKSNGDINAFNKIWSNPSNQRAFAVALGPTTTKRLDTILDTTRRLTLGEEKSRPFRGRIGGGTNRPYSPITFFARVLGSQAMKAGGFATLQAQSAGAAASQKGMMKAYEALFKNIPPEVLFREALLDPTFERMLLSRLGNPLMDKRMGRAIRGSAGGLETQIGE